MISELLTPLREVTSLEEGVRLLFRRQERIDDALVEALRAEAAALRAAGDPEGAAEAETWAEEARCLLTRRLIFSFAPDSPEAAQAHLRSLRERFDDAFVAHCARVAAAQMGEASEAGEGGAQGAQAWRAAEREVYLLGAVAAITGSPLHRGQARLCEGTLLLLRAQAGGAPGPGPGPGPGNDGAAAAASALRACADDSSLPPSLRARACWARRGGDLAGAAALHEANLEDSERALWREAAPLRRTEEARAAQQDIEALLALALEAGRYERALEIADQGKARAFLRDLADVGRALGPVPPRLLRRRQALLARLAALGAREGVPEGALRAQLRALGVIEAQIEGRARARALDLQCAPLRFADLPALAPADGAILSCSSLPERLVLFLLDRNGLRGAPVQVPLSREALRRAALQLQLAIHIRGDYRSFDALQRQLDERLEAFWPTEAQRFLYDHLIAPLEDRLAGLQTLWIIPHGPLGALPFQALLAPGPAAPADAGEPLGARLSLGCAPSLAVLAACKRRRRRWPARTCFVAGVAPPLGPTCAVAEADAVARRLGCAPAFLRGGAGAVLASLWPVADRAALPLMDALYAALAQGRGVAPALRQAQDTLRQDPRMRHPYFWAPFCLWGAPD
jgi:hypothetical protein